jgi:hypothetical protein
MMDEEDFVDYGIMRSKGISKEEAQDRIRMSKKIKNMIRI